MRNKTNAMQMREAHRTFLVIKCKIWKTIGYGLLNLYPYFTIHNMYTSHWRDIGEKIAN